MCDVKTSAKRRRHVGTVGKDAAIIVSTKEWRNAHESLHNTHSPVTIRCEVKQSITPHGITEVLEEVPGEELQIGAEGAAGGAKGGAASALDRTQS